MQLIRYLYANFPCFLYKKTTFILPFCISLEKSSLLKLTGLKCDCWFLFLTDAGGQACRPRRSQAIRPRRSPASRPRRSQAFRPRRFKQQSFIPTEAVPNIWVPQATINKSFLNFTENKKYWQFPNAFYRKMVLIRV